VNWIVDNLPAATKYVVTDGASSQYIYMNGFPVGESDGGKYFIHNHVRITLSYHENPSSYVGYRIVGFEVEPRSLTQAVRDEGENEFSASCGRKSVRDERDDDDENKAAPMTTAPMTTRDEGSADDDENKDAGERRMIADDHQDAGERFELDNHKEIWYTYDIVWVESSIRWASRWDNYLKMAGGDIYWLSVLNSALIALFLTGLVAMILLRTLHRDIVKYNELASKEEIEEETGWKLVHGDVFRKPAWSRLLAATIGSGVQILAMAIVTIIFGALGFLSPAHRGGLLQSTLLLFTIMGAIAGYTSARFFKLFQGANWKQATWLTALLYPGVVFGIFFFLNLLIWGQASAGAVPFATMFSLLVLWFGISVPLVFVGGYLGSRKEIMELPVRTNQMPREVPMLPFYMKPIFMSMCGGVLPFGAVFTELFFIMSSIWQHQIYYMFGFLVLVLLLLIITCAEVSVALTYFQLTSEDYHWWWRSFFSSAFSGVYVFIYSWVYFDQRLQIEKASSVIIYFGYMFIVSGLFALMTGAIGLLSSFVFVKAIYGSIKVD